MKNCSDWGRLLEEGKYSDKFCFLGMDGCAESVGMGTVHCWAAHSLLLWVFWYKALKKSKPLDYGTALSLHQFF